MTVDHTTDEWQLLRAQIFVIYFAVGLIIWASTLSSWLSTFLSFLPNISLGLPFGFVAFPLLAGVLAEAGVYALDQQSSYFNPSPKTKGLIIGLLVSVLSLLAVWEETQKWGGVVYFLIFSASALYIGIYIEDSRWMGIFFGAFGFLFSLLLGFSFSI